MNIADFRAVWIDISSINSDNTAFKFRKDLKAEELAISLKEDGQKFPVTVWRRHSGELQLISGFRRMTAAKQLGWEKLLAVIIPETDMGEDEALKLNFVENIDRKSLNSLDIMFACQKLSAQGKSNVEIGKLIGKSENQVRRYLKVAGASAETQEKVKAGEITIKQAGNEQLAPGGEVGGVNKNNYVKSIKNGFDAVIKFRAKRDDPTLIKQHIDELTKVYKEALKWAEKKMKKARKAESQGQVLPTGQEQQTSTAGN